MVRLRLEDDLIKVDDGIGAVEELFDHYLARMFSF